MRRATEPHPWLRQKREEGRQDKMSKRGKGGDKIKTDEVVKLLRKIKEMADESVWACNDGDWLCEQISEFVSEKLKELQKKQEEGR